MYRPLSVSFSKLRCFCTKARQEKKVAIVTGSSSGIGQGIAVDLARLGYAVTLHGRNIERLQKTSEMCLEAGCRENEVFRVVGDVSEDQVLKNIAEDTYSKFGRIDVLINNAGVGFHPDRSIEDVDPVTLDEIYKTNLRAPLILSRHVTPALKETQGSIVNISSISVSNHRMLVYSMLKAALEHATMTTALELAPHGVRINCIRVGAIWTPIWEFSNMSTLNRQYLKNSLKDYFHPIRRLVSQDDINNAVRFMLSEDSSFITGVVLPVAGGAHLPYDGRVLQYREQKIGREQLQKVEEKDNAGD